MSKNMSNFGPWIQTRNVISAVLGLAWDHANSLPFSEEPASEFVKTNSVINDLLDLLKQHALLGLKQIDEAIAEAGLIDELKKLSSEAKVEADRIKNATKKLEKFTEVVGKITKIVEKIPSLPFI